MLNFLVPVVSSTIFVVDIFGNTTILDVYTYEIVVVDLMALYEYLLYLDVLDALENLDSAIAAYDNVISFGDYRGSYYDM